MEFIGLGYVCVCIPVYKGGKFWAKAQLLLLLLFVLVGWLCILLLLVGWLVRDENSFEVIYEFALVFAAVFFFLFFLISKNVHNDRHFGGRWWGRQGNTVEVER